MIRIATKDDSDAVYRLIKQLSSHEFTKKQFNDCYLHNIDKGQVLVYEKNNVVCGCIVYDIHYYLHFSRRSAEIVNLVVDENVRGRGLGKELLAHFEPIAKSQGCVCIEVDSGKHREAAHRFYMREGFEFKHYKFTKGLI